MKRIALLMILLLMMTPMVGAQDDVPWEEGDTFTFEYSSESETERTTDDELEQTTNGQYEFSQTLRIDEINETKQTLLFEVISGGSIGNSTTTYNGTLAGQSVASQLFNPDFEQDTEGDLHLQDISISVLSLPTFIAFDDDNFADAFNDAFTEDLTIDFTGATLGDMVGNVSDFEMNGESDIEDVELEDDTREIEITIDGAGEMEDSFTNDDGEEEWVEYDVYTLEATITYEDGVLASAEVEVESEVEFDDVIETSSSSVSYGAGGGFLANLPVPGLGFYLATLALVAVPIARQIKKNR